MPHERGPTPVLPSEFSSTALADRKIRIRRELPAARTSSTTIPPDPRQIADPKEVKSIKLSAPRAFPRPKLRTIAWKIHAPLVNAA
jgi:hypothetical protein